MRCMLRVRSGLQAFASVLGWIMIMSAKLPAPVCDRSPACPCLPTCRRACSADQRPACRQRGGHCALPPAAPQARVAEPSIEASPK